jgi:tetratricopeptide (TPR) repeat protein
MSPPAIGSLINERYRLDAELGRGGMGIVYRAHDTLLDRDVAIKVLSSGGLGSEGRARLLREAQAVAKLNHPNIVKVFDAGKSAGISFVVMELLEGDSLYEARPTALEQIVQIMRQVCSALDHAHTHGIVHRDLKLENVIVSPNGTVTLTDFGLARSVASRDSLEGALVGTVFYIAPEQALGQPIDGRTDLYALGVMLYELTARRLPFGGDDPLVVVSQHLYAPVVPPSTYNPAIPPTLDALIVSLLAKEPQDRPASAAQVLQVLDDLASPSSAPPARLLNLTPIDRLAYGRLIGRERELAGAKALWRQALVQPGETPVMLIHSEAGVGKTPLVREIRTLASISRGSVLVGECYPDLEAPYAPITQIVREAVTARLAEASPAPSTEATQAGSPALATLPLNRSAGGSAPIDLPEPFLADLLTLAPDLHSLYPDIPPNPNYDPHAEQQRLFESVVTLCALLAASRPLLLVVEDLQWADSGTLYLLLYLARRSRSLKLKLLIVLTYRDGELDQACCLEDVLLDLNRERLAYDLHLSRLTHQQTSEVLNYMFQAEVSAGFVDSIYQVTEGNLFFIEEVCKSLIDEEKLFCAEGCWHEPSLEEIHIPPSVQATIQARVGKLPEDAQQVLRVASIIGREFDYDTLYQASEMEEEALIEALEAAERAQLIDEVKARSSPGRVKFIFPHALTMATLREGQSSMRQRLLHRRIAQAIETLHRDDETHLEALAYHYEQAGVLPRACEFYRRAGERALAVYANQEAERHLLAALAIAPPGVDRARLHASLGEALFRLSRYLQAAEAWQEAIALYQETGDVDHVAQLYARAARATWYAEQPAESLVLCLQGMALVQEMMESGGPAETPGLAALLHETARAYRFNHQPEEALSLCQQALAIAQHLGLVEVQAEALATLGILPDHPAPARLKALQQAVELAESAGLLATAARAHLNLGANLHDSGDLPGAQQHVERARQLSHQIGNPAWEYDFTGSVVSLALEAGDLTYAGQELDKMLQLRTRIPNSPDQEVFLKFLEAMLLFYRGEWEQSIGIYQTCREKVRSSPILDLYCDISLHLAEARLEIGQAGAAKEIFEEVLAIQAADSNLAVDALMLLCLLSTAEARLGQMEAAHDHLGKARQQKREEHDTRAAALLRWAEARLAAAEGASAAAQQAYAEAIGLAASLGARWFQARMQLEAGQVWAKQPGQPAVDRARQLLEATAAYFERMNAPGYLALANRDLQALPGGG